MTPLKRTLWTKSATPSAAVSGNSCSAFVSSLLISLSNGESLGRSFQAAAVPATAEPITASGRAHLARPRRPRLRALPEVRQRAAAARDRAVDPRAPVVGQRARARLEARAVSVRGVC